MNKTGMRVYNINSQSSFCSSELLLNGSEQSYRQIGQSSSNGADIRLSLIRPHQSDAHSPDPPTTAAHDREALQLSESDHRPGAADLAQTNKAAQGYQAKLGEFKAISSLQLT